MNLNDTLKIMASMASMLNELQQEKNKLEEEKNKLEEENKLLRQDDEVTKAVLFESQALLFESQLQSKEMTEALLLELENSKKKHKSCKFLLKTCKNRLGRYNYLFEENATMARLAKERESAIGEEEV